MEVILLKDVEHLGLKGDVVGVKRGYARNYLLPRQLAEVASAGRIAEARRIEAEKARHEARTVDQAHEVASVLGKTVLRFEVKAGPSGTLFGSVTPSNIADEIWRTRKIRIDRRKVEIEAIRKVGRHFVTVNVFEGVSAQVKTLVVPEGGELTDEELEAITLAEEAEARATAEAAASAAAAAARAEEAEAKAAAPPAPAVPGCRPKRTGRTRSRSTSRARRTRGSPPFTVRSSKAGASRSGLAVQLAPSGGSRRRGESLQPVSSRAHERPHAISAWCERGRLETRSLVPGSVLDPWRSPHSRPQAGESLR